MMTYSIALLLPAPIKKSLSRLCFGLPTANWIEEENLHIQIIHLGKLDGAVLLDIEECLNQLEFHSFSLSLNGIAHDQGRGEGGAITAHIAPCKDLEIFKSKLQNSLRQIRLSLDKKNLQTKLTLARYSAVNQKRLAEYFAANSAFTSPVFIVDGFDLISTHETEKRVILNLEKHFSFS